MAKRTMARTQRASQRGSLMSLASQPSAVFMSAMHLTHAPDGSLPAGLYASAVEALAQNTTMQVNMANTKKMVFITPQFNKQTYTKANIN